MNGRLYLFEQFQINLLEWVQAPFFDTIATGFDSLQEYFDDSIPYLEKDVAFSFTFGADDFKDPDNQPVSLSIENCPSFVNFNATTREISGTPLDEHKEQILNCYIKLSTGAGLCRSYNLQLVTGNLVRVPNGGKTLE